MRYRAECICNWRDPCHYFNTAAADEAAYHHFKRMGFDRIHHSTRVVMLK